ncbi:MAG: hypothetical protein JWN03_871 [Nocardia sp.]|nr:hypothetical protein [Nocardia sp.]
MPRREHHIVVTSELRDPPDLRKLSRAIINIAKEKTDDTRAVNDGPTGVACQPEQPEHRQEQQPRTDHSGRTDHIS